MYTNVQKTECYGLDLAGTACIMGWPSFRYSLLF